MAITNNPLDSKKRILSNAKYVKLIPYKDEGTTLGTNSFTFDTLLADSTSFQNDDPTTNQRDSETKDEPAVQNTVLGAYQFATTSLDVQDEIIKAMMGWTTGTTDNDVVYAPVSYKPLYAMLIIGFTSTTDCLVAPKLKLNTKMVVASLKTSSGEVQITGTAYAGKLTIDSGQVETPSAFVPEAKLSKVIPSLA